MELGGENGGEDRGRIGGEGMGADLTRTHYYACMKLSIKERIQEKKSVKKTSFSTEGEGSKQAAQARLFVFLCSLGVM